MKILMNHDKVLTWEKGFVDGKKRAKKEEVRNFIKKIRRITLVIFEPVNEGQFGITN